MRSQQVNFYLLPEEQEWFESQLRSCGDLVVIRKPASPEDSIVADSTIIRAMGREDVRVYLSRRQDLPQIDVRAIPSRNSWSIDELRSPVVEFSRCYFDGQLLRRGRLYVITHYYDENSLLVEKQKSFVNWAKTLISTTKKTMARREDGDFIAPLAKERAEKGEIKLSAL